LKVSGKGVRPHTLNKRNVSEGECKVWGEKQIAKEDKSAPYACFKKVENHGIVLAQKLAWLDLSSHDRKQLKDDLCSTLIPGQLIKARPAFHKHTFLKPMHRSAEFCSACHKVHLPEALNGYRWLRGQNHYDSFLQSGVSGHRVDSFYYPPRAAERCSSCHMPLVESGDPAARDFDGKGRRQVHDHRFLAANTGVPHMMGLAEEMVADRLSLLEDVARVDIFALREDGEVDGALHAPLDGSPPVLQPGRRYLVEAVVRVTRVGHLMTQGTADSNEVWLDVEVREGGRVAGRSGAMDPEGRVDPWSWFGNAYVLDREGRRIDRRNAQDIFVALYNHQIPPGAAAVVRYLFEVPAGAAGPLTISARLNYRNHYFHSFES